MPKSRGAGPTSIRSARRSLGTTAGAVILAAVVVVGGVGAYVALSASPSTVTTNVSCEPTSTCVTLGPGRLSLSLPYTVNAGQLYDQVAVGENVSATVAYAGPHVVSEDWEAITTYSVQWGPGITTSSSTGQLAYTYSQTGLYTIVANATDRNGVVHTGFNQLASLLVNPTAASVMQGYDPTLATSLTNSSGGYQGWIGAGGSVTVNGSYSRGPVNATWSAVAPTLVGPSGSTVTKLSSGTTWATATYTFPGAGYYGITLVVPSTNSTLIKYQNFTWGVYVATSAVGLACASCHAETASPHPGTMVNYEVLPGGALDLDPAADYYSAGYEVGQEFDESLIALNGTDTGQSFSNFVPEAATCVPGSPQCAKLYGGDTLVNGTNVTFVIDKAAHFYDPFTNKAREVYPSDVMFSLLRAILYTQYEGVTGYYVGFDIAGPLVPFQALEPTEVNSNWDLGPGSVAIHAPFNNTPYYTLDAFGVNDSNCPAIAMSQENGCITLHADADAKAWPALLQVLSIISAGGIEEAGWYAAHGASVPGFVCNAANPDAPCLLPGDTNTTASAAYLNWVRDSLTGTSGPDSPYGWDSEIRADINYPTPVPAVSFSEVGSGPYYLASANPEIGYTLRANPYYEAPTGCAGQLGCLPRPGEYVANVTTYWLDSDATSVEQAESGYADAAMFSPSDFPRMWDLVQSGELGLTIVPSLTTSNFFFNMQIELPCLDTIDSSPPQPINIPANALANVGLRAVLEYAYPYATAQSTMNVIDGVGTGVPFGGSVPPSETSFYDANVPWPNYNTTTQQFSNPSPGTGPGTAAWYWAEAHESSSLYYDPQLSSFSPTNPLYIPVPELLTDPGVNAAEMAWARSVAQVTGGSVQLQLFFYSPTPIEDFQPVGCDIVGSPFNAMPIWFSAWVPDYPSPVDNWEFAYGPDGLWGSADSVAQTLMDGSYGGEYAAPSCGHEGDTVSNFTFWADYPNNVILEDCQGIALNLTSFFSEAAAYGPNLTLDLEYWDLVQAVYNNLELTVGASQSNNVFTYGPWIDPGSVNGGALIGAGGEWCYYGLTGNELL